MVLPLVACTADTPLPLAGERCSGACDDELVCVDGLCRLRPETPLPVPPPGPPMATFDVSSVPDADTLDDTLDDSLPDPEASPLLERLVVGAFDETRPADTRLALAVGQAVATEVSIPSASRPELVRVTVFRPDTTGCGIFRSLLWVPRDVAPGGDLTFDIFPSSIGEARMVEVRDATPNTVELALPDFVSIPPTATRVRFGARFEGPCTTSASPPFVLVDTSADLSDTFIWSEAWVPGADLSLPGRFAIELQLLVDPP